jgi:hypothetical protein
LRVIDATNPSVKWLRVPDWDQTFHFETTLFQTETCRGDLLLKPANKMAKNSGPMLALSINELVITAIQF